MSTLLTVAILVLIILGAPVQAQAAWWWTICNRTAEDLDVAIAYYHTSDQWLSEGWWTVRACGGCARVMDLSITDRVNQYFRAVARDGSERIGGDQRFCVSPHAKGAWPWTGRSGPRCGGDYVSAGFRLQEIEYSDKNFTTNIRGSVPGRTCID